MVRNKERLVAQGFRQEEGIDYTEVFAPVARVEAIRLFLAFASYMGFKVYQMDVKSAFLYGKIEEEVYITQPQGFEDPIILRRFTKLSRHFMDFTKHQEHGMLDCLHFYWSMDTEDELLTRPSLLIKTTGTSF